MTDNTVNSVNSDSQSMSDVEQPLATNVVITSDTNSDTQTPVLNQSDEASASLQQAAAALVQYVQIIAPPNSTATSDNTDALHAIATSFMQQTATVLSTNAVTTVPATASDANISDSVSPTNLKEATSSFVQHLGDILVNPQASDTASSAVLMQDVQEIWKNKSTTDTVVSTASSIWESVKSSQHLPVIAGMLASVIFKKK